MLLPMNQFFNYFVVAFLFFQTNTTRCTRTKLWFSLKFFSFLGIFFSLALLLLLLLLLFRFFFNSKSVCRQLPITLESLTHHTTAKLHQKNRMNFILVIDQFRRDKIYFDLFSSWNWLWHFDSKPIQRIGTPKTKKKNQLHEFPPSNATIFSKSSTAFSMKTFTKFPFGEWFSLKFDDFRWMRWFWWDDSSWKYNLLFENKCGMMTCPTELKKNEECTEFLSTECAVRCEHGATIRLRFGLCQTNERETVLPQWRFSLRCVSNQIFAFGIPWLTDLMTVLWLVDVS